MTKRERLTASRPAAPTPAIPLPRRRTGMLLAPVQIADPTRKQNTKACMAQYRPHTSAIEALIGRKTVEPKT